MANEEQKMEFTYTANFNVGGEMICMPDPVRGGWSKVRDGTVTPKGVCPVRYMFRSGNNIVVVVGALRFGEVSGEFFTIKHEEGAIMLQDVVQMVNRNEIVPGFLKATKWGRSVPKSEVEKVVQADPYGLKPYESDNLDLWPSSGHMKGTRGPKTKRLWSRMGFKFI